MLALHPEHLDHLSCGGTIVVPSPQRAAALRLAYSIAQLSAGRCVWPSPDILPWNAWLGRGLDEARARGVPVPRRLSVAEEWWLWRDSVRRACEEVPVLSPEALAGSVRRSTLLLEDYGLELRDAATVEATVLLRARSDFQQRCAAARSLWSASWKACAPFLKPARATRLAGFAELGPARRSWLERNGITVESIAGPSIGFEHRQRDLFAPDEALVEVSGFDSPELEAEAAADWCARCLDRDPRSHLLLVVPRLPEQRHRWMRALAHRLDYKRILGCDAPADSPFVLEGGQPLTAYPLINVAMLLLSLPRSAHARGATADRCLAEAAHGRCDPQRGPACTVGADPPPARRAGWDGVAWPGRDARGDSSRCTLRCAAGGRMGAIVRGLAGGCRLAR